MAKRKPSDHPATTDRHYGDVEWAKIRAFQAALGSGPMGPDVFIRAAESAGWHPPKLRPTAHELLVKLREAHPRGFPPCSVIVRCLEALGWEFIPKRSGEEQERVRIPRVPSIRFHYDPASSLAIDFDD